MNRPHDPEYHMKNHSTYEAIWNTVRLIPKGKVATYGQIARLAGLTGQARLVGYALHAVPSGLQIPWHRIVNAKGAISLPKRTGAYRRQKERLLKEGIMFRGATIDLTTFGLERE
jgi:methylated-DNA-protein-cysteine methyltransferase-like protein